MEVTYYRLTVDQNFEGGHCYDVLIRENEVYIKPWIGDRFMEPARKGYAFGGWYHDSLGEVPVANDERMKKDVTIYASWKKLDDDTAEWMERVNEEAQAARYICDRPNAYTKESFQKYFDLTTGIRFLTMSGQVFPREMEAMLGALSEARSKLRLRDGIENPDETIWYIWENDMPREENADEYNYLGSWDNKGFRPFLVPYLLDNQEKVKGNIIIVAGGGAQYRANRWEAYPSAKEFNELGYNCFVLQRRVAPSAKVDGGLDLQRAVRYLKYYAQKYNIAKIENLTALGFSGGGKTVQIEVSKLYGNIKPTIIYPKYKCDEIDEVNSDISNMILIYSAEPLETSNPNIPDAFVVVGMYDEYQAHKTSIEAIDFYINNNIRYEAHFFSDIGHGFGSGFGIDSKTFKDIDAENVKVWPKLADMFLSIQYGTVQNIKEIESSR